MTDRAPTPTHNPTSGTGADALTRMSAAEIARMTRSGDLDPVELIDATLQRIHAVDGRLHAYVAVLETSARAEAQSLRNRADLASLPLAGVPVAIKDNIPIAGEPTTHGSRARPSTPASADALIVQRLRAAGSVIVGRTVMPELAIWPFTEPDAFPAPRNPWNTALTPGGSSGGSAVAVAARMAAVAVGSDGGGSIRVPAACCGIVGLKPAPGLVPLPGARDEHWYGLTAFGPLARTVEDAALMLDVLAGTRTYRDPVATTGGLRIAVSTRHPVFGVRPAPGVRQAVELAASVLGSAGHSVIRRNPRYPMLPTQFTRPWLAGIAQDADELDIDLSAVEPRSAAMIRRGHRAQQKVTPAGSSRFARYIRGWFGGCDVLLTPVLATPPVRVGTWHGKSWVSTMLGSARWLYTNMWNVAGVAAMAVPAGLSADGLPLAVQLIAPAGSERLLLSVAAQLERLNPWPAAPDPEGA